MNRHKNIVKHTALYCRLSQDDGTTGESMSISSQKMILENHAKNAGIRNYEFYIDDGYSGLNFNRPAFKQMITSIENGLIDCVITKDLSRLGRNYIESGAYIEVFFPQHAVRYISVNDGVDSTKANGMDITPFKNILNEFYSRDISKKVKTGKAIRAAQGKFMGNSAPFGYMKDPKDKNHLIVDETTAPTVRLIFELALQNFGNNRIMKVLFEKRLPKPSFYKQEIFGKMDANDDSTYDWKFTPIMRILRNPVYKGGMWERTTAKTHFKQKTRGYIKIADRTIIEDVHEAIVSKHVWQTVQDNIDSHSKYKPNINNIDNIFRGKLRCDTCGHTLLMRTENKVKKPPLEKTHYECTSYRRRGVAFCSSHKIKYLEIYNVLLNDIRQHAERLIHDKEKFLLRISKWYREKNLCSSDALKHKLDKFQKRNSDIDTLFFKVYDDYASGLLNEDRFNLISQNYENEQVQLKQNIENLKKEISDLSSNEQNIKNFSDLITDHAEIKELNASIINTLVDKVVVSDAVKQNGEVTQKIKIYYKFVGSIE